jgi:hypothetical protein
VSTPCMIVCWDRRLTSGFGNAVAPTLGPNASATKVDDGIRLGGAPHPSPGTPGVASPLVPTAHHAMALSWGRPRGRLLTVVMPISRSPAGALVGYACGWSSTVALCWNRPVTSVDLDARTVTLGAPIAAFETVAWQ